MEMCFIMHWCHMTLMSCYTGVMWHRCHVTLVSCDYGVMWCQRMIKIDRWWTEMLYVCITMLQNKHHLGARNNIFHTRVSSTHRVHRTWQGRRDLTRCSRQTCHRWDGPLPTPHPPTVPPSPPPWGGLGWTQVTEVITPTFTIIVTAFTIGKSVPCQKLCYWNLEC